MRVSTVEQMRDLDNRAIEAYSIKDELLMENAGLAAFRVLADRVRVAENSFAVVCGSGNNGGDGRVIARKIHSMGGAVTVILPGDPEKFT